MTLALLLTLAGCAPAPAAHPIHSAERDPALTGRLADGARHTVMVGLVYPAGSPRDGAPWRARVAAAQQAALACAGLSEADVTRRYTNIPALAMELDAAGVDRLAPCPTVELLADNHTIVPHLSQSLPLIGASTTRAITGFDGTGAVVAILDTGIDWTQSELGGCIGDGCKVVDGYDFADSDDDPSDCHGHGSNVSAIAAGTGGVAPGAGILAYKVFGGSDCSFSDDATLTAALDEVVTASATYEIAAVNMSLGYSGYAFDAECDRTATEMRTAVKTVYDAGIPLFVSAGNDGYTDSVSYPACLSRVITVANAYDANVGGGVYCTDSYCYGTCTDSSSAADQIQCTSNGGPLVEIAAPGTFITAGGQTMGGTSQAAPHVAGAAALLWEAAPDATPDQIYRWLVRSDATVTDSRSGATYTYPRLDLPSAFVSDAADLIVAGGGASDEGEGTDGDGDGLVELGETVAIDLSIANAGPGDLEAATVTLSSDEAWAEIVDGDATLGPIEYGETAPLADSPYDFLLTISPDCAADAALTLTVTFTDDEGNEAEQAWTLPVTCLIDDDGDGALVQEDCDDSNSNNSPLNDERCDGEDDDCDGLIDEDDAVDAPTWYADADGDGHGDITQATTACAAPEGWVAAGDDCDDASGEVFTGAVEVCDGLDQDCDGAVDEDTCVDTAAPDSADKLEDQGSGPGCGCASSGAAGGWVTLALLAGLSRRRQTQAVPSTRGGAR